MQTRQQKLNVPEGYRWCPRKNHVVPLDGFALRKDGRPAGYCRDCAAEANRLYQRDKVDRKIAIQKRYWERRINTMNRYGGRCVQCGESDYLVLTFDHKNPVDGKKHREENISGGAMQDWIIKNDYPESVQVLCWNCNMRKKAWTSGRVVLVQTIKDAPPKFRKSMKAKS